MDGLRTKCSAWVTIKWCSTLQFSDPQFHRLLHAQIVPTTTFPPPKNNNKIEIVQILTLNHSFSCHSFSSLQSQWVRKWLSSLWEEQEYFEKSGFWTDARRTCQMFNSVLNTLSNSIIINTLTLSYCITLLLPHLCRQNFSFPLVT